VRADVRAIDTNVVVRFLTNDDRRQAKAARAAIEAGDIYIALTALLEAEWALRSGPCDCPQAWRTAIHMLEKCLRYKLSSNATHGFASLRSISSRPAGARTRE